VSFVRTAKGDVDPDSLGFTYSHEHILCVPPYWAEKGEDDLLLDDPDKSKADVEIFRKAGGRTIVDATAVDYGRRVAAVAQIGHEADVNIVFTAGFNKSFLWSARIPGENRTYAEWIDQASPGELVDFVVGEVESGLEGTSYRAGQVKFGTGYNVITPLEEKTIRAVARAHHLTGAPIHSHTEAGTMALEQIAILREEDVDPRHLSVGHMDRNPDPWLHLKVADTGAYLSFDGIGKVKYHTDQVRIDCILNLVRRGHEDQVLISGDTARKSYYRSYGHGLGLGYIIETFVPRLREQADEAGLDGERLVQKFFVDNPKRCFAFKRKSASGP
jgi:predicted metal-dependent phosphotriesterase family hydrolase